MPLRIDDLFQDNVLRVLPDRHPGFRDEYGDYDYVFGDGKETWPIFQVTKDAFVKMDGCYIRAIEEGEVEAVNRWTLIHAILDMLEEKFSIRSFNGFVMLPQRIQNRCNSLFFRIEEESWCVLLCDFERWRVRMDYKFGLTMSGRQLVSSPIHDFLYFYFFTKPVDNLINVKGGAPRLMSLPTVQENPINCVHVIGKHYYTKTIATGPFNVRGHWRLYKKSSKLVEVKAYSKKGYTRRSKLELGASWR